MGAGARRSLAHGSGRVCRLAGTLAAGSAGPPRRAGASFQPRRIAGPRGYLRRRLARTADWALIDRVAAASSGYSASVTNAPHSAAGLPGSAAVSPIVRLLPIVASRQRCTTEWMNALSTPWLESTRTLSSDSLRGIIKYLSKIGYDEIVGLEIPTGKPIVYELADDLSVERRYDF